MIKWKVIEIQVLEELVIMVEAPDVARGARSGDTIHSNTRCLESDLWKDLMAEEDKPFSIASYATSRHIRCWGSMALASEGVIEKNGASNSSIFWFMKWPPHEFEVPGRSGCGW